MTRTSSPLLCCLLILLVSLAQTGCQRDDAQRDDAQRDDAQPDKKADATEVTLQVVDKAGYEAALAKLKGKVVLVDFWATWCLPCREGFPHTVEWNTEYAEKGLAAMSVSMEFDPAADKQRALEFLTKQKANFTNLLDDGGAEEEAFERHNIIGGIPHYKLYDRVGKLLKTFSNEDPDNPLDPKEIEAAIRTALELPAVKD
jgi:thiol-disulfide isomerase/thioredoxin